MIAVVCGGGQYPHLVIKSCIKKGLDVCLLIVDKSLHFDDYPQVQKLCVNFGNVGKALEFFKLNGVDKVVFAGNVKRAPEFFTKHGIEWLYRLCKQPSRFVRMLELPRFGFKVLLKGRKFPQEK